MCVIAPISHNCMLPETSSGAGGIHMLTGRINPPHWLSSITDCQSLFYMQLNDCNRMIVVKCTVICVITHANQERERISGRFFKNVELLSRWEKLLQTGPSLWLIRGANNCYPFSPSMHRVWFPESGGLPAHFMRRRSFCWLPSFSFGGIFI